MTTPVSELLRAAREKVAMGWTQGVAARDARGNETDEQALDACKWCSIGALWAVGGFETNESRLCEEALVKIVGGQLSTWNDSPNRTQSEVLSAFDAAIAAEESK